MPELMTALRGFNRKERYLVVQWALGNPGFQLGDGFRKALEEECGLDLSGEAMVAMDYHLDWLYAALRWASDEAIQPGQDIDRPRGDDPPRLITGSQEDVDLLVATAGRHGTTNVVLCEAKGYSQAAPTQMAHKVERLRAIFGEECSNYPGVVPRLVLLAPKAPEAAISEGWPGWMRHENGRPYFVPIPPPEGRYALHRNSGDATWSTWSIVPALWRD